MKPTVSSAAVVPDAAPPSGAQPPSRVWLWFLAAFLLQLAAWVAWFAIAVNHRVDEVPLATTTESAPR